MRFKKIAAAALAGACLLGTLGCGGEKAKADDKAPLKGKELVMYVSSTRTRRRSWLSSLRRKPAVR